MNNKRKNETIPKVVQPTSQKKVLFAINENKTAKNSSKSTADKKVMNYIQLINTVEQKIGLKVEQVSPLIQRTWLSSNKSAFKNQLLQNFKKYKMDVEKKQKLEKSINLQLLPKDYKRTPGTKVVDTYYVLD